MKRAVVFAVLAALSATACATEKPQTWAPRKDADLRADLAECKTQANSVNYRDAQAYSDTKYGAAAAIASRTNGTDLTNASLNRMYDAITYECMTDKGWKPAN